MNVMRTHNVPTQRNWYAKFAIKHSEVVWAWIIIINVLVEWVKQKKNHNLYGIFFVWNAVNINSYIYVLFCDYLWLFNTVIRDSQVRDSQIKHIWKIMSCRTVDVHHVINAMIVENFWQQKVRWKYIWWCIRMRKIFHVVFAGKDIGTKLDYNCIYGINTPMKDGTNVTIARKNLWIYPAWKFTWQSTLE